MQSHKLPERFLSIRQNLDGLSAKEIDIFVHTLVDDSKKRRSYDLLVKDVTLETRIHIAATLMANEAMKKEERDSQRALTKAIAENPYGNEAIAIGPDPPISKTVVIAKIESIQLRKEALAYRATVLARDYPVFPLMKEDTVFIEVEPPPKTLPSSKLTPIPNSENESTPNSGRYSFILEEKKKK